MILRLSTNAQRGVLVAASCVVAVIPSYFSIRNALAAHYAGLQTAEAYERAIHLEPANPRNWYLLGRYWQYNLGDPDAGRAIHSYLSALSLNPSSSEIWVWNQSVLLAGLADLQSPPGSVLWDGGFESGIIGGGFSWRFFEGFPGVHVGIDTQERHSGKRSLRLIFDGKSNINFAGICHYVPVQSSTSYRFSAWVRTGALTTDQGIRFQLHSLGTQDVSTAVTPDVHGTAPWTHIELPWSSGKDVQELQVCLVRFPSEEAENKIQGTAWVDDVSLVPEPAEHPKP